MVRHTFAFVLICSVLSVSSHAQSRQGKRRGALLGGLAGAAIGAAIGDKGDNETAGALIGGAIGAITGGSIGNQYDQQRSPSPYPEYQQPNAYRPRYAPYYAQPNNQQRTPQRVLPPTSSQTVMPQRPSDPSAVRPMTVQELHTLWESGISEKILLRQLQLQGLDRSLSVHEVIRFHQAGYSETLLEAMQTASPKNRRQATRQQGSAKPNPTQSTKTSTNQPVTNPVTQSGTAFDGTLLLPPPPRRGNRR